MKTALRAAKRATRPKSIETITTVERFIERIRDLKRFWAGKRGYNVHKRESYEPVRLLFRGARRIDYPLISPLARSNVYKRLSRRYGESNPAALEREILGRFKRYAYRFLAD